MKYEFFVIKPRTSTKVEEVSLGIEVTKVKCFVMCHATSKYNHQVILARGGWVETHPRHSQVVAPGIVHVSRSITRGFFLSSPRMIQTVTNEREQWSRFSSQSKFVPKSRKLFSAFLCRSSLANSDIIKNPNLGEAGRGKLSSTKKLSQAFLFAYQCRSFKHILVLNQRNGPQYRLSHVGTMRSFSPYLKQNSWIKNLHTWRMPITFVVLKGSREGWH